MAGPGRRNAFLSNGMGGGRKRQREGDEEGEMGQRKPLFTPPAANGGGYVVISATPVGLGIGRGRSQQGLSEAITASTGDGAENSATAGKSRLPHPVRFVVLSISRYIYAGASRYYHARSRSLAARLKSGGPVRQQRH